MKKYRIRRTEQQWERIFGEYAASGQTQREFCESRGIGLSSFVRWLSRVERKAENDGAETRDRVELIQAEVVGVGAAQMQGDAMARYELVVAGERRLRVGGGFNPGEVATLVDILEGRWR